MLILIISITLYGAILVREFEHVARNEAKQVAVAVRHSSEYEMLNREILSIYSAHTQAERESMDAESYRALYAEIQKSRSYHQLKGLLEYHHFADLDIHTGDEVEDLSLTMANMERELLEIEESLTAATTENQRISTELSLASRIQANSLPGTFPPFPERKDLLH